MRELSKAEETILLSIMRLGENAYGVSIRNHINEITGKDFSFGNLYGILDQMVKKGYTTKVKGEPTRERGGRSKVYYRLTREGIDALKTALEYNRSVWNGITDITLETAGY